MNDIYDSFNEKHVQQIAHNFLIRDYEIANATTKEIFSKMEAYTINDNRADGFLAIRTSADTIYTVSLECKRDLSSSSLRWVIHPRRLIYMIFTLSMSIMVALFSFYFWLNNMTALYIEPLIVGFILTFFTILYISFERYFNKNEPSYLKTRAVYLQLDKYPADEKWLAFSIPLNENERSVLEKLYRECKNRGYGLLLVDVYTQKVYKRIQPKSYINSISNNLKQYKDKKQIEEYLMVEDIPNWKIQRRSRAEIYYFVRNTAVIIFLIVAIKWLTDFFEPIQTQISTTIEQVQPQQTTKSESQQQIEQEQPEQIIQQEAEPIIASTQILLDNAYDDLASAKWRIKKLNEIGIEAKIGHIDDFEIDFELNKEYFVFLDAVENELKTVFYDYQEKLFSTNVKTIDAKIVTILWTK